MWLVEGGDAVMMYKGTLTGCGDGAAVFGSLDWGHGWGVSGSTTM